MVLRGPGKEQRPPFGGLAPGVETTGEMMGLTKAKTRARSSGRTEWDLNPRAGHRRADSLCLQELIANCDELGAWLRFAEVSRLEVASCDLKHERWTKAKEVFMRPGSSERNRTIP